MSAGLAGGLGAIARLIGGVRLQRGDEPDKREPDATAHLVKRDLADITVGAAALPGAWHVETTEDATGGIERAWLRPLGDMILPSFGIARRDDVIMVRVVHTKEAGSLVFGAFGSVVAALDAIHNCAAASQQPIAFYR